MDGLSQTRTLGDETELGVRRDGGKGNLGQRTTSRGPSSWGTRAV